MILEQSNSGLAGMVLAETIVCLSRHVYEHILEVSLIGSPLTLFLWLTDKLRLFSPPPPIRPLTAVIQFERLYVTRYAIPSVIEDDHDILHFIPRFI